MVYKHSSKLVKVKSRSMVLKIVLQAVHSLPFLLRVKGEIEKKKEKRRKNE